VFNPLTKSVADLDPESLVQNSRVKSFEAGRYRSSVIAAEDEIALESRVSELKAALENAESEYEKRVLPVRIGKLTSGIARLNIFGPFQGETREKRDRAEDAWMAIRGAVKHGACPGGGYVLVKVAGELMVESEKEPNYVKKLAMLALSEALKEPVRLIYHNYGFTSYEAESQLAKLLLSDDKTFDVSEQKWVDKTELLDSVPAVVEAIRNSLSIASLLGTAGGIIAFGRDSDEDAKEADFVRRFEGAIGERGSISGE
jgi:chaperonin GroEL